MSILINKVNWRATLSTAGTYMVCQSPTSCLLVWLVNAFDNVSDHATSIVIWIFVFKGNASNVNIFFDIFIFILRINCSKPFVKFFLFGILKISNSFWGFIKFEHSDIKSTLRSWFFCIFWMNNWSSFNFILCNIILFCISSFIYGHVLIKLKILIAHIMSCRNNTTSKEKASAYKRTTAIILVKPNLKSISDSFRVRLADIDILPVILPQVHFLLKYLWAISTVPRRIHNAL